MSTRSLPARVAPLAVFLVVCLAACDDSPSRPHEDLPQITLTVTGGLAGADLTLHVDGEEGVARGVRCVSLCGFVPGETLMSLSSAQISELQSLAREGGLPDRGDRDFGTACCDLFVYEIEYAEGNREARIVGDQETLPEPLAELARRIHAMSFQTLPAMEAIGAEWGDDPPFALSWARADR